MTEPPTDLFDLELVLEASRRMLHRGIEARTEEALHFLARSTGQRERRMRERFDRDNNP